MFSPRRDPTTSAAVLPAVSILWREFSSIICEGKVSRYQDLKFLVEKWKTQVCIRDWPVTIASNQWNSLTKTMCHRSGTIYQPTETRYIFVQVLILPALRVRKPADAMHKRICMYCLHCSPASVSTWDVPSITWWWWTSSAGTRSISCRRSTTSLFSWGRDTTLYATKTWLQKKENLQFVIVYICNLNFLRSFRWWYWDQSWY